MKQRRKLVTKDESIRLRCTAEEKQILERGAKRVGLGVSSWLLSLGLREAQASFAPIAPSAPVESVTKNATPPIK